MPCQDVHTIPNLNGSVTGIALLNDRLYFSHTGNPRLAFCCPATFQFLRYLDCYCPACKNQTGIFQCKCYKEIKFVPRLQHIVACNIKNCIYVAVQKGYNYIFKVALDQNNTLSSWTVVGSPSRTCGLSITSSHNLLFASDGVNSLHEYSPDGEPIRQISLEPAGIKSTGGASHAVQLSDDQFGVTCGNFLIVSSDGQLVQSYPDNAIAMRRPMPRGIAVDHQQGRIFVANQCRILVIDSKLSAYPVRLTNDYQLNGPQCIHYDAASRRLYIGEGNTIVCCQL